MRDEVKYRAEIVQAICKEVPPRTRWDVSHVQGRSRLSMVRFSFLNVELKEMKGNKFDL